jgi:hypothetical protein
LYVQRGGVGAYQTNALGLAMTGAYGRIEASHSMNPTTHRSCQLPDLVDQIGCLVEASPCSMGVAGIGPFTGPNDGSCLVGCPNHNTVGSVRINKQSAQPACLTNGAYPL